MDKYLIKKTKKYVIATLDNPTMYLKKVVGKKEYFFVDNIEMATKTLDEFSIQFVLNNYYLDTGMSHDEIELVYIPIEITYELINETCNGLLD